MNDNLIYGLRIQARHSTNCCKAFYFNLKTERWDFMDRGSDSVFFPKDIGQYVAEIKYSAFMGNALIKAMALSRETNMMVHPHLELVYCQKPRAESALGVLIEEAEKNIKLIRDELKSI